MREQFIERKFNASSALIIEHANRIIASYQAQGFTLTLRQLYYQFVSRDLIPNKATEYKRLGSIINDARLAGLIDWSAIEDRGRNLVKHSAWKNPADIIDGAIRGYALDPWKDQDVYVMARIEKDALLGVIEPVCDRWRVPYIGCRGYTSQSEAYETGQLLRRARRNRKRIVILYLGDHDPSGVDMTRDNTDRLSMFTRMPVEVRRLALNLDQIEEYDPPPNPTKDTDIRATGYRDMMEEAGQDPDTCWELDALEPQVIDRLIDSEIKSLVDRDRWVETLKAEKEDKRRLQLIADEWEQVNEFLDGIDPGADEEEAADVDDPWAEDEGED